MKLIIEGNYKKVNQIKKELIQRVKSDKLQMTEIMEGDQPIEQKEIKPKNIKK